MTDRRIDWGLGERHSRQGPIRTEPTHADLEGVPRMYKSLAMKFRKDEEGATATEYALLVVAIALIMVVGALVLGNALSDKFSSTGDCVATNAPGSC